MFKNERLIKAENDVYTLSREIDLLRENTFRTYSRLEELEMSVDALLSYLGVKLEKRQSSTYYEIVENVK